MHCLTNFVSFASISELLDLVVVMLQRSLVIRISNTATACYSAK